MLREDIGRSTTGGGLDLLIGSMNSSRDVGQAAPMELCPNRHADEHDRRMPRRVRNALGAVAGGSFSAVPCMIV